MLHATLLGLLSALAPLVPHTAEDAWQALPSKPPGAPSVFQAGWFAPPTEWAAGLSAEQAASWADVRAVRDGVNTALERARVDRLIGASLEAQVMLHVSGNAKLADTLAALNGAANGVDELRYLLIVSQAQLVAEPAAISSATKYVEKVALPEGRGEVTVGVAAAAGRKCARCWNYSADVGSADAAEHPELCGRCVPVVRQLGFKPIVVPPAAASTATDDAAAAAKKTPAPASTAAA